MALDTQTFSLSRWWAKSGLQLVQNNPTLFAKSNLDFARRELIAGSKMLPAIRSWLLSAQLIRSEGSTYGLERYGKVAFDNDPEFKQSATWWSVHLLLCHSKDPAPYDWLFRVFEPASRTPITREALIKRIYDRFAEEKEWSVSTLETYLAGVLRSFARQGPFDGLGFFDIRDRAVGQLWKLGDPEVPDSAILLGLALARERHFPTRRSIDFSEFIKVDLDHFLMLTQDELRARVKALAQNSRGFSYTTNANLDSLTFDAIFSAEGVMKGFLQEGADTWM